MPKDPSKLVEIGETIDIWGWVMFTEPFFTAKGERFGDTIKVKTVAKKKYESEEISIYLSIVVRSEDLREKMKPFNKPLPIHVKGVKRWQKIYPNLRVNAIEPTKHLMWMGLFSRGLSLELADEVPEDVLVARGATVPPMTLTKLMNNEYKEKKKALKSSLDRHKGGVDHGSS